MTEKTYRTLGEEAADAPAPDAPVILSDEPGSFARRVLAKRHPALVQQVRDAFPYGRQQHEALDALLDEITDGVIEPLATTECDHERWAVSGQGYFGRSWYDVPFLWSESYFYRKLLGAVGYFGPGPWQGVDPFAPFKKAELGGEAVEEELHALEALANAPAVERSTALLHASLWGNRADLGFRFAAGEPEAGDSAVPALVADDSVLLWQLLPVEAGSVVAVVADNAGRELIPDLILIDHLLEQRHADRIVLYVKPYPYYVSDAMTADVVDCLRRLVEAPGEAGRIGGRLWKAMAAGRLEVHTHPFFCAPQPYGEMPEDLRGAFGTTALTILKGDLNYRRLVGDRSWDAAASFTDLTRYFPGAVAALRTLKSDVIVGLEEETLDALERSGGAWRTSGTHALIQVRQ
ncbi:protein-glutamate O-methyltransferase family protein [Streptomyces anulatus]|uniref:Protein-glutamate O-methyltransferase family protein n=2 Tax=Streptomyces TaxID=1883 RepID=A0A6G3T0L4_STRAQ|nr:damage-control phosphatase ARMT1 family protein [Streptomyces anulatus]NDZ58285.1 protein-glutamate O-methyltransferase family protein [Streptomyces anulatus]NEB88701.1 protein-glutamate O-methyltransferase family protein [Streptomyces anulatus]